MEFERFVSLMGCWIPLTFLLVLVLYGFYEIIIGAQKEMEEDES